MPKRAPLPWRRRLAILLASSVASLVLLEFSTRMLLPQYNPAHFPSYRRHGDGFLLGEPHARYRQVGRGDGFDVSLALNAHGLRDTKDLALASRDDLFVVGDSFSMGSCVAEEKRYSNLLEKLLGRPVYNLSIPNDLSGYRRLVSYAEGLGPPIRHLIVGVCMENDLMDYEHLGETPAPPRRTPFQDAKQLLSSRSAAYNAVTFQIHARPALKRWAGRVGLLTDVVVPANQATSVAAQESAARQLELLLAGRDGLVLLIPSRALWMGNDRAPQREAHDRFAALLRSRGLRVVDPLPDMEAAGNPLQTFHFPYDGHWNEAGHRKAAEVLHKALRVQGGTN